MLIQKVLSVQGAEENSKFLRSMQNVRHIVRTQVMNDIKEEKTRDNFKPLSFGCYLPISPFVHQSSVDYIQSSIIPLPKREWAAIHVILMSKSEKPV